jgi:3-hydroxybutyryl-CoA dehydratase
MSVLPEVGHKVAFHKQITARDVDLFADLTGDKDLIHVDEDYAAKSRFGARVVHGALLVGLIGTALTELSGSGFAWLGTTIRFRGPVNPGETVLVEATVTKVRVDKPVVSVEISIRRESGEIAIDGEAGLMRLD